MAIQPSFVELDSGLEKQFEKFQEGLNGQRESNWNQSRLAAASKIGSLEFPTIRHEEWKYTNVKKIVGNEYAFDLAPDINADMLKGHHIEGLDAMVLVFVNGKFNEELSTYEAGNGVEVANLSDAYATQSELIEKHFAKYAKFEEDIFTALNTAFAYDGAFIHVKKSTEAQKPILLLNVLDSRNEKVMAQPRNLIIAEDNSRLSFMEDYLTIGDQDGFINVVTEIFVGKDTTVEHYKLQNKSSNSYFVGTTQVEQLGNSHYHNTTMTLGGGLIRNNLNIALNGEHCEAFMTGLYMLNSKDHVDNHSTVDHLKPNSYSNQLYKGIMDDRSTGVFNGKIFVREDAQKTNAFQSNKNILLSDNATINTKPQLEIWADDVKCSHGCTTGALDEEPLFYLKSRGIPEQKAKAMLMQAFANDVLDRIKVDAFKEHIENLIASRLDV
ncbi:Fe-S cluster assembly protein SufD [Flammeovirgaceae bacterium SG7u.111]|nr:Fe-S cluster assembly protein SufD [Flammeovirgaceae bacterium SG7u.132]WPO33215.1 Fe-S cluster assembly protein SufD [Flammeovirgaceae bacterium SG7u.111]